MAQIRALIRAVLAVRRCLESGEARFCGSYVQHKDHHAVHGQTAVFIADQYFKTQSAVKHSSKGHAYLGMREAMFENVVRDLLCEQGKKVEVYVGSRDKWQLSRNVSVRN